ncbi:MAG: hypothetical protein CMM58_11800 [Rhodospirillaceae bacterium]|nr:hypothetical protein [Rhodospirillaceae bacterium]
MEFLLNIIPPELTTIQAFSLIAFSYLTSAITVTFGIGGGVMMLMAMASMMPVASVIPVHGAVQMGSNGGRAWIMRGHLNWPIFKYFFLGSVIGAAVAGQIVISLPKDWLRLILGIFVVWIVWAPKLTKRDTNPVTFIPVGIVTTFASMFVGATGLLIGAFLAPDKLGRMVTVSTHATCAMLQHGLKIIVFGMLGFAFWEWLPFILAMVATGFIGTYTGKYILHRIPEKVFSLLFKGMLTLLAIRLVSLALFNLLSG